MFQMCHELSIWKCKCLVVLVMMEGEPKKWNLKQEQRMHCEEWDLHEGEWECSYLMQGQRLLVCHFAEHCSKLGWNFRETTRSTTPSLITTTPSIIVTTTAVKVTWSLQHTAWAVACSWIQNNIRTPRNRPCSLHVPKVLAKNSNQWNCTYYNLCRRRHCGARTLQWDRQRTKKLGIATKCIWRVRNDWRAIFCVTYWLTG
jgi:hypothetical protein